MLERNKKGKRIKKGVAIFPPAVVVVVLFDVLLLDE